MGSAVEALAAQGYSLKQSLRGRLLHFYYRKGNWVVTGVLLVPDGTSNATRRLAETFLRSQDTYDLL